MTHWFFSCFSSTVKQHLISKSQKPFVRRPYPTAAPFKPRPMAKIRPPPMKAPWSPPDNLYLFWGKDSDKWTSAEAVRHLVKIVRFLLLLPKISDLKFGAHFVLESFRHRFGEVAFFDLSCHAVNNVDPPSLCQYRARRGRECAHTLFVGPYRGRRVPRP